MPSSQNLNNKTPCVEIVLNSVPLQLPESKYLLEVNVTEYMSPPNYFGIRMFDRTIKMLDAKDGLLREGSRVEISMGYDGNMRKMLVGEITAISADFSNEAAVVVQAEGYDLLHRMSRGTFYRKFEGPDDDSGLSDSDIVTKMAAEMKLSASVDPTPQRNEARVQNHVSDLVFLDELARLNGYFIWMEGDTVYFKKELSRNNTIQLQWGATLVSFSSRFSIAGLVNEIEVRGWDQVQKGSFSAGVQRPRESTAAFSREGQALIAGGSGGVSRLELRDTHISSQQEAKGFAEAMLAQQRSVISAAGACIGRPEMRVGARLEISNTGRFEGAYVVEQVSHTYGAGGYMTTFQAGRSI